MKRLIIVLTFWSILVSYPASGLTQNKTDEDHRGLKRWSISYCIGSTSSGPAGDIEKAMRAGGFNDTQVGGLFGGGEAIAHPFSKTGFGETGFPMLFELHYLINPYFSIGAIISNSPIGQTLGYHDPLCDLFIDYSVATYAPVFSVRAGVLRLGIGPAWNVMNATRTDAEGVSPVEKVKKLGILLDLGLSIPRNSRFFVELKVQYRSVGKIEIGPYESKWETEFARASATFPRSKVNYSHLFYGIGIGFRL